jgi:hypothetical protein
MMLIETEADHRDSHHCLDTDRSASVQIGRNVDPRKYVRTVCYSDIECAIAGDEANTFEEARESASGWVALWAR